MDEDEILINNNNMISRPSSSNSHYGDYSRPSSTSGEYHRQQYNNYDNNERRMNQRPKPSDSVFKERYKNVKIHIILVNCNQALTNDDDKRAWTTTFNSLAERLIGRYDINNITIHVTDEPFGIVKLALTNYVKRGYNFKTETHYLDYNNSASTPDRMRERNERMVRTIADIRDNDPDNVFPLIIAFNSERNLVAIENFRELSHEYKIKMIEKRKRDGFMYSPDFNQINFFRTTERKRITREEYHDTEEYHQSEEIPQKPIIDSPKRQKMPYQHIENQEIIPQSVPTEEISSQKQIVTYGEDESNQFTDRDIIDFETETPNDFIEKLKITRKIPEPLVSYDYYPNGSLWKISTMLVFPNADYPNYQGEE